MFVVSHPTGNRNVRAVLTGLANAGMLAEFHTTVAVDPNALWLKLLPDKIREEFLRRTYPVLLQQVNTDPVRELLRMILPKIGLGRFTKGEHGRASIDAVYKSLDRKVASRLPQLFSRERINAVYAYEDGALNTFTCAKELGLKCAYDLPIVYWEKSRRLLLDEAERLPAWAITLAGGILDSSAKLERKTQELEMADIVICPGQFVADSLPRWANGKQKIIAPFGSPELQDSKCKKRESVANRPLRFLFAGSMTQRKGLGDLFAAFHLLKNKNIQLVVLGSVKTAMNFYKNEMPDFIYEPGRPHQEVLKLMQTCDVFCLPSIVEGRALVMQEAMSQGLPLIITANTGGEDLIKDGMTGFLVPIRSPELIAEKINWFFENRDKIPEMGRMAQEHAAQYTWAKYEHNIISGLKKFFN